MRSHGQQHLVHARRASPLRPRARRRSSRWRRGSRGAARGGCRPRSAAGTPRAPPPARRGDCGAPKAGGGEGGGEREEGGLQSRRSGGSGWLRTAGGARTPGATQPRTTSRAQTPSASASPAQSKAHSACQTGAWARVTRWAECCLLWAVLYGPILALITPNLLEAWGIGTPRPPRRRPRVARGRAGSGAAASPGRPAKPAPCQADAAASHGPSRHFPAGRSTLIRGSPLITSDGNEWPARK